MKNALTVATNIKLSFLNDRDPPFNNGGPPADVAEDEAEEVGGGHIESHHYLGLDGGHLCVSSPAETLELQRVVAEAHGPAGWRGPFLQLKLQVVKVREIMVPHGLSAGGPTRVLPAAAGSTPLLAGWPQRPADVAAAALAAKVICVLHTEVTIFAC